MWKRIKWYIRNGSSHKQLYHLFTNKTHTHKHTNGTSFVTCKIQNLIPTNSFHFEDFVDINKQNCLTKTFNWGKWTCILNLKNLTLRLSSMGSMKLNVKWGNLLNLLAPCVLCIGQAFCYSPENAFYIFNQQIYFIIWYLLDHESLI